MQAIVEDLGSRLGITCLLVSHDAADTLPWADEILVLQQGRLVQQGPPAHIYQQPVNEYTAALFGDYNLVQGADRRALLPGQRIPAGALLLRPEQLRLGPPGSGAPGVVRALRFLGSYYEVEIALGATIIRARTDARTLASGDLVHLSVSGKPTFITE
ncbi:TOBE domain-containing protein [Hymenobacter saemangeumensis]